VITRNVARRLERLEYTAAPTGVRKVWQIVIYDTDRSRRVGPTIDWPRIGPGPTLSERFCGERAPESHCR